ncbi:MAG: hypothetical protein GY847_35710, partial [Proteobacteria bacterium]|nr:hypothetical protein [Pseudomonadota bacterium]
MEHVSAVVKTEVKGSLRRHAEQWAKDTSDPDILSIVREGYAPPFTHLPPPFEAKNNSSASQNEQFVLFSILELLENGFAKLTRDRPRVVNPITVSCSASGKKRLIADMRHVNKFLKPQKFKLDDIRSALPALRQAEYLFSFDFHKAYYHIDLREDVQKFFGFSFVFQGQKYYAYYTIACFGLSTVPHLFNKLLLPLVKLWRKAGLHLFLYLDDGLGACSSLEEALFFVSMVREDLSLRGIFEQTAKCNWSPTKELIWLGILINLIRGILVIPEDRVRRAQVALDKLLNRAAVTARQLIRFAGQVNSMAVVIGPMAYIQTKQFFRDVVMVAGGKFGWDRMVPVSDATASCLRFWRNLFEQGSFERSIHQPTEAAIMFSDASAVAGASFVHSERLDTADLAVNLQELEERGPTEWSRRAQDMSLISWTEAERRHSSTWRELKTILAGLQAFKDRLQDQSVTWYTDSACSVAVARRGSMKTVLNPLAEQLSQVCASNNIDLRIKWIRRTKNTVADGLSRFVDLDDWGVSPELLHMLYGRWQRCDIDRFATDRNAKLPRFDSRFASVGAEGIDTFGRDWSSDFNLLVP